MLIRNAAALGSTRRARHAVSILEAGLAAADPARIVSRFVSSDGVLAGGSRVPLDGYDRVYTVAFGKAADSMSRAVARILPVQTAMMVVPRDSPVKARGVRFRVHRAGHPYPDRGSVAAAKAVLKFLRNREENDFVLFLVSGGASALLALPNGVALQDKAYATRTLLRCGASISEINCVRKHMSGVKGGRLVENMPCAGAALLMSDVEGDDPGTIASGATYMDETTFAEALDIIEGYGIESEMGPEVVSWLREGAAGRIPETPKEARMPHQVMANNRTCLDAMSARAAYLGYAVTVEQYFGDVGEAADSVADRLREGGCLVFGGEPRVCVTGRGKGGRCQEMVLRTAVRLPADAVVACMGTDGIDGNTRVAGAIHKGPAADADMAASCCMHIRKRLVRVLRSARRAHQDGVYRHQPAGHRSGPDGAPHREQGCRG